MNRSTSPKSQNNRRGLSGAETMHGNRPDGGALPDQDDWLTGSGIIDRMLAYRDWWNLPGGRMPGSGRDIR